MQLFLSSGWMLLKLECQMQLHSQSKQKAEHLDIKAWRLFSFEVTSLAMPFFKLSTVLLLLRNVRFQTQSWDLQFARFFFQIYVLSYFVLHLFLYTHKTVKVFSTVLVGQLFFQKHTNSWSLFFWGWDLRFSVWCATIVFTLLLLFLVARRRLVFLKEISEEQPVVSHAWWDQDHDVQVWNDRQCDVISVKICRTCCTTFLLCPHPFCDLVVSLHDIGSLCPCMSVCANAQNCVSRTCSDLTKSCVHWRVQMCTKNTNGSLGQFCGPRVWFTIFSNQGFFSVPHEAKWE